MGNMACHTCVFYLDAVEICARLSPFGDLLSIAGDQL